MPKPHGLHEVMRRHSQAWLHGTWRKTWHAPSAIFSPNRKQHCMEDSAVEEVLGDVAAGGPRKAWEASGFPHSTGPVELSKSWPKVASVSLHGSPGCSPCFRTPPGRARWTPPGRARWGTSVAPWCLGGHPQTRPRICAGRPRGRNRPAGKLDMKLAPQWEHVLACQASPRAVQVCRHHKQ